MEKCKGTTKAGTACKKIALAKSPFCSIHSRSENSERASTPTRKTSKKSVPKKGRTPPKKISPVRTTKKKKERTPPVGTGDIARFDMDFEYRTPRMSPDMTSLEWSPTKKYVKKNKMKDLHPSDKDSIPFPEMFELVHDKLMELCREIPFGACTFHQTMPGILCENNSSNYNQARERWRKEMNEKGNHYSHYLESEKNNSKVFGEDDVNYCYCQEGSSEKSAYNNLIQTDKWFQDEHSGVALDPGDPRGNKFGHYTREITPSLKNKILRDSVELLAQEYKIHLQPKPEYQIPVLKILIKLITEDPEFLANLEAWKTVIPYHRAKSELNLPVIVIYPIWGKVSATIVLKKIINAFSVYDCSKIGLNHTPRFNHKVGGLVSGLVYYANGAGDQKTNLPVTYFTGPGKEFYKGDTMLDI